MKLIIFLTFLCVFDKVKSIDVEKSIIQSNEHGETKNKFDRDTKNNNIDVRQQLQEIDDKLTKMNSHLEVQIKDTGDQQKKNREELRQRCISKENNLLREHLIRLQADLRISEKTATILANENDRLRKEMQLKENERLFGNRRLVALQDEIHSLITSQVKINCTIANCTLRSQLLLKSLDECNVQLDVCFRKNSMQKSLICPNGTTTNYSEALYEAASKGQTQVVQTLLEACQDPNGIWISEENPKKESALRKACVHGHIDIVVLLLKFGADVNYQSLSGVTPLTGAALYGHVAIVKILLAHEAKVDMVDNDKRGAVFYASLSGHTEILLVLVSVGADVKKKDADGNTPMSVAATYGNKDKRGEIISILKTAGAT